MEPFYIFPSVRTGPIPVDAWNLSCLLPHFSLFHLQTHSHPPSCPSSPGKPSQSCVSKFTTRNPRNSPFFLNLAFTRSDTDCFQARQVPVILLRPPKGSVLPPELVWDSIHILNFTILSRVDFVQDLYLKELKVYKPAPKVPPPALFTCPQRQNSFATLTLFLGCQ